MKRRVRWWVVLLVGIGVTVVHFVATFVSMTCFLFSALGSSDEMGRVLAWLFIPLGFPATLIIGRWTDGLTGLSTQATLGLLIASSALWGSSAALLLRFLLRKATGESIEVRILAVGLALLLVPTNVLMLLYSPGGGMSLGLNWYGLLIGLSLGIYGVTGWTPPAFRRTFKASGVQLVFRAIASALAFFLLPIAYAALFLGGSLYLGVTNLAWAVFLGLYGVTGWPGTWVQLVVSRSAMREHPPHQQ